MKHLLIIIVCITATITAKGQIIPQFQTTIHVEDAIGNRDSVVVGFDTLATSGIDEEFGELEITTPFDSILEMRAGAFGLERDKLSKIIIEWAEASYSAPFTPSGCYSSGSMRIYIWAKYQPVTVSWNREVIQNESCIRGSFLSNHYKDALVYPYDWDFYPQNMYSCMADTSRWEINTASEFIDSIQVTAPISIEKKVTGLGEQTIYGIRFSPSIVTVPCHSVVSTEAIQIEALTTYPNPVKGYLSLQLPNNMSIEEIQLFDSSGQLAFKDRGVERINLSALTPGIYFLQILGTDGKTYIGKIIKI